MRYGELAERLNAECWALMPERLNALVRLVARADQDAEVNEEEVAAALQAATPAVTARTPGSVALIPLIGIVQQREDVWTRWGFATSCASFAAAVRQAVADPTVKAVVFDVDSPGGSTSGVAEASDVIFGLRGEKPMVAVSNTLMASAAYDLAAQADEVVASPSSLTGSIGVWMAHVDLTGALEAEGIKVKLISAGKYKTLGTPYEPLSAEHEARLQAMVDVYYQGFLSRVARGRGTTAAAVKSGFGEGDVLTASAAKAAGLVDKVATLEQTLARFGAAVTSAPMRAAAQRELAAARYLE